MSHPGNGFQTDKKLFFLHDYKRTRSWRIYDKNKKVNLDIKRKPEHNASPSDEQPIPLQTNWLTKRKRDPYFILGASESLTRRDYLKETIRENMEEPEAFGLYPKQHNSVCNNKKHLQSPCDRRT